MIRNRNARALKRKRMKPYAEAMRTYRGMDLEFFENAPVYPSHVVVARAGAGSLVKRAGWQRVRALREQAAR